MKFAILLVVGLFLSSCGGDECVTCTLAQTSLEVCESNYEELAARNNLEVTSLQGYIDALNGTGFVCE